MPEPHFGFILSAFAITIAVVGGMVISLLLEHRRLKADLTQISAKLPASGEQDQGGRKLDGE